MSPEHWRELAQDIEKVTGIGGVFVRAKDPQAMATSYLNCMLASPSKMGFVGTFARINDPEGNPIELWQMTEGLGAPPS